MAENTAANHGEHFNESIVNEVILEDMKKNRIDHMKYLPGMETMEESDVMEKMSAGHWNITTARSKIFRHFFPRQHFLFWRRSHRRRE